MYALVIKEDLENFLATCITTMMRGLYCEERPRIDVCRDAHQSCIVGPILFAPVTIGLLGGTLINQS